mgnify:FL=1|jgi:hypothetical protein
MKWKKNEILVSLLCVFPSVLLITATLFVVPRVAATNKPEETSTAPIVDIDNQKEHMPDAVESVFSNKQKDMLEDERLEHQQEAEHMAGTTISQTIEFTTSEEIIENSQTVDFTDLATPENMEFPATSEGITTNVSEEGNQTSETVKSTETTGNSYP